MEQLVAMLAVDKTAFHFDADFSYVVPPRMADALRPGCRVMVPFGRADALRLAMVMSVGPAEADDSAPLKAIRAQIDAEPVLSPEMMRVVRWLSDNTFCSTYEAIRAVMPPGAGLYLETLYLPGEGFPLISDKYPALRALFEKKGRARAEQILLRGGISAAELRDLAASGALAAEREARPQARARTERTVRLTGRAPGRKLTEKGARAASFLEGRGAVPVAEVCYHCLVTPAVIATLVKSGVCEYDESAVIRAPQASAPESEAEPILLSSRQREVRDALVALARARKPAAALLYGVTGSGKTNVYRSVIEALLHDGRSAIVLVPEIALTPAAVALFQGQFGGDVAVLHSGLSAGERYDQYRLIREGKVRVAVGTRSAVFAPFSDLGLIVIDEEQESSYHSSAAPRFDARDVAALRCKEHGALMLLCSATPLVTSFYYARTGRYHLFTLDERPSGESLPQVLLVDRRGEGADPSPVSRALVEAVRETVARGEQAMILINRRGYSPHTRCTACGAAVECPNCSAALTYHAANGGHLCHHCGYAVPALTRCPRCGGELRRTGKGTQSAAEQLAFEIPGLRVARMDTDTTSRKDAHRALLQDFAVHRYDVLLGTQMIAKGHDFPGVTLVGVLSADNTLYSGDPRAAERTFSLLTQVVGRGGRGDKPGRALIETYDPSNRVIALAAEQDYESFYDDEIMLRRALIEPPFCDVAVITLQGPREELVKTAAAKLVAALGEAMGRTGPAPYRVIGPFPAGLYRVAGNYRWRTLLKCKKTAPVRGAIRQSIRRLSAEGCLGGAAVTVDFGHQGPL